MVVVSQGRRQSKRQTLAHWAGAYKLVSAFYPIKISFKLHVYKKFVDIRKFTMIFLQLLRRQPKRVRPASQRNYSHLEIQSHHQFKHIHHFKPIHQFKQIHPFKQTHHFRQIRWSTGRPKDKAVAPNPQAHGQLALKQQLGNNRCRHKVRISLCLYNIWQKNDTSLINFHVEKVSRLFYCRGLSLKFIITLTFLLMVSKGAKFNRSQKWIGFPMPNFTIITWSPPRDVETHATELVIAQHGCIVFVRSRNQEVVWF